MSSFRMKSSLSRHLFVALALVSTTVSIPVAESELESRTPNSSKNVIIQMFEWTWDSIAAECTNFIGPAGYGYVQTSPPQEHPTGPEWWTDYQPVSYILTSKRGSRQQFASMVQTCHTAGVNVIADTIFNHMTGGSGTGVAGSTFTMFNYPGIYQDSNFHHCGLEPDDTIVNYDNAVEVQTCELEGLADLATETEYVRSTLAAYANDLFSLGVDGLRLDAAKHIAVTDLANITSRFTIAPYITQEVIYGAGEPITPNQYVGIGDVQEFRYTDTLLSAFSGGGISSLQDLEDLGWVPGDNANVFVTNHDTERDGSSLNSNSPSNTYTLGLVFSLAHSYGTPTILSSYSFTDSDDGAPNGGTGTCTTGGGENGWLCQHRWVPVVGMVGFHNNVGTAAITNWVSPQSEQIAFGRGSLGYNAINNADTVWTSTFTTALADGTYCDVITGAVSSGKCTGVTITVSHGSFSASVPARNAIAIHTGAKGKAGNAVWVSFSETATTNYGENIFLVGSISQLGSWDADSAIALSAGGYPTWTTSVILPPSTTFQYKFIRKEADGSVVWEDDPNRSGTSPASGTASITTSWQ